MANPLKMLKLKPTHFQFIQEVKVSAPPKRVWAALMKIDNWLRFQAPVKGRKATFEPWVGGRYYVQQPDGTSMLHLVVTYIEPGKLLRMSGPMGLSHLPVCNAFIFELQPKGKGTLLRFCQRSFGYMDADVGKRYAGGWKQLLQQIKELAEKKK